MTFRSFFVGGVVLAVAAVAWHAHDPAVFDRWRGSAQGLVKGAALSQEPAATGLRKCRGADGRLSYTDGDCPAGTRAEAIGGGSVSVLPAPAVRRESAGTLSTAASAGLLPALAGPPLDDAKRRQIDKAIDW